MIDDLRSDLQKISNPEKAIFLQRFFKTDKGGYAEGDIFLGITVPASRSIAIKYSKMPLLKVEELLRSKIHEERLIALLILVHQFNNGSEEEKKPIYKFYLLHLRGVNNWDLVDLSADKILGGYLLDKPRTILRKLAKSKNLWKKRIAMVATYQFIKEKKEFKDTFEIAELLLHDQHDLIHKAVGWMLREVGKHCSQVVLEEFLKKHYKTMPRAMLRYAIERFPQSQRRMYIEGRV